MSEFGQPARTATSDANAGLVDAPTVKEASRQGQAKSIRATDNLESGLQNLGSSLGKSLSGLVKKHATNMKAQQELDGAIAQGEDTAMNAIAADEKRTGWSKALFGQSGTYRGAQQQAVQNNVQQAYVEQANTISKYAAENATTYKARLKRQLDAQLENFPDDAETRQLITANWAKSASKLAHAQGKEHYAYTQQQNREAAKLGVRATLDVFTTDSKMLTTPEEAKEFVAAGKRFYNMAAKPKDMEPAAYRGVINEELVYSLEQGNIGAYNMAESQGWLDKLNPAERKQIAAAINKYDIKAGNAISLTVSEARIAAKQVKGPDAGKQVDTIVAEATEALTAHAGRKSGTDKYNLNVSNAKERLIEIANAAVKAASKAEVEAARMDDIVEAQNLANAGSGIKLVGLGDIGKDEAMEASSIRFTRQVGSLIGNPDVTTKEAVAEMFGDPIGVAAPVVQTWGDDEFDAGYLKVMGQSYINGFTSDRMTNEDGQPTEAAKNAMQVFAQFEQVDRAKFRKQIGEDAYDEYSIIKDGQLAGKTEDMIKSEIKEFKEAAGNRDMWATNWDVAGKLNQRDYIVQLVQNMTQQAPSGRDVGIFMETYKRGLDMGKGDHARAKDYLYDKVRNKSEIYRGQVIHNADRVELENHTVPQLLEAIQNPENNLATGLISLGVGNSENENGNPIRSFNELGDVRFEVSDDGGMWIKHHKFQHNVYMSPERIKTYEKKVTQNKNEKALEAEIQKESAILAESEKLEHLKYKKF